jgi:Ca2+-binding RTX toxin-like protein
MALKRGTAGSDTLTGTGSADDIYGLGGNDGPYGGGGKDRLYGGTGIDALFGQDGDDQAYGEAGDDYIVGGTGNDYLHGGSGADRLRGDDGNDTLVGGIGDDVRGGAGHDTLVLEASGLIKAGSSLFAGDAGTDTLLVRADSATVQTNSGPIPAYVGISAGYDGSPGEISFTDGQGGSRINVGQFSGIDKFAVSDQTQLYFFGGSSNSTVSGSNQDDVLISVIGDDVFNGRAGSDDFVFLASDGDVDQITGFDAGDRVIADFWTDSDGNAIAERNIVEQMGQTVVTTSSFSGETLHTLYIDAIGIPMTAFREWDFV